MKIISFLYETFQFLEVKISIYLNRRVLVMAMVLFTRLSLLFLTDIR